MNNKCVIKICGIKDPELAKQAVSYGANFIGIMHYAKSPRHVTLDNARAIAHATKAAGGIPVMVCVDLNAEEMVALCNYVDVDTIQLHGHQPKLWHHQLPKRYKKFYVCNTDQTGVVIPESSHGIDRLDPTKDLLLFDRNKSSNQATDFSNFSYQGDFQYIIAGGLKINTVNDVVKRIQPDGVDVSGGVESSRGNKCENLIKQFIEAVK